MPSSAARKLGHALGLALGLGGGLALLGGCTKQEASRPYVNQCVTCHGSPDRQGSGLDQAALELAQAAPPTDLLGNTDPSFPGVGAHQYHLQASYTHAAVACTECHVVPAAIDSPGHADSGGPAEFVPGPLARRGGRNPKYDAQAFSCSSVYCHLEDEPKWTEPVSSELACKTCHGSPPPEPHPTSEDCAHCHDDMQPSNGAFAAPERHVDGKVDLPEDCFGCHGTKQSYAPPTDLSGSAAVSSIGVGAHQAHLAGGDFSRPCPARSRAPGTSTPRRMPR